MKEQKRIYLLNEAALEEQIHIAMEELDMNKASMLLNEIDIDETSLDPTYIQDIKERTLKKLELEVTTIPGNDNISEKPYTEKPYIEKPYTEKPYTEKSYTGKLYKDNLYKENLHKVKQGKRKGIDWKGAIACAAVIVIVILGIKHDSIVLAFQEMISLIPGVGIVDSNLGAEYRLKEQVTAENDQTTMKILYVTATENTMTVRFDLEGTYQEKLTEKNREERYNIDVFLLVNNQKIQKSHGSSGAGLSGNTFSYNCNYTFELDQKYINTKRKYTLVCEELDIRVSFRLSEIDQYTSLNDIGATQTHNNISLTASAFLKDDQLSVNVYPINNSNYNLISFNQEYNLEYFGKKMTLNTDKGIKKYIPPSYYGTGLNAPFLFDVSDDSSNFELLIPFVVVESEEIKGIDLPIPEEGEAEEVNKEIKFEYGSAIIKSVKRLAGDIGNEYGYLQINLEYTSLNENQQLVSVEFTGKNAIGFYPYFDDQNRTVAVSYMLNESDTEELQLSVINPRYVIMDSYQLDINVK
jgi:hypothetical protein